MEGIFEPEYQQAFDDFKTHIPKHVGEALDDAIGWICHDLEGLNHIQGHYYVWKKPEHINCPPCFVMFRMDIQTGRAHAVGFYPSIPMTIQIPVAAEPEL